MSPLWTLITGLSILALLAALFWPDYGLWPRLLKVRRRNDRVLTEDLLKCMLKMSEAGQEVTPEILAGTLELPVRRVNRLLEQMAEADTLRWEGRQPVLTDAGREAALHIIRAHRLWETYLAQESGFGRKQWHRQADEAEHRLSREEVRDLYRRLGHPSHDPHGDPIPTPDAGAVNPAGEALATLSPGQSGKVVHIEDEPAEVHHRIVDLGITVGEEIKMLESDGKKFTIRRRGRNERITPALARNIHVEPVPLEQPKYAALSDLGEGEAGKVVEISKAIKGAERRRLFDLGLVPGTVVHNIMNSPMGDPHAYEIRGATIALRDAQANEISIIKLKETEPEHETSR